jgi:transposase
LPFWDGLPAHRAILVKDYLEQEKFWLKAVRLPAYAPELNPPEYLWSSMKAKDICNLRPDGLKTLKKAVGKGYRRVKHQPDLLIGFLKASQLF